MAELIRDGAVVADDWTLLRLPVKDAPVKKQAGKVVELKLTGAEADAEAVAALPIPAGKVIVPLAVWLARRDELAPRLAAGELGVWLDSYELAEQLAESTDVNAFPVIGLNFPKFVDGRGYSSAALLRTRYGYRGELRAIGDVLRDQIFYLARCGFNAFALRADQNTASALAALKDFTTPYQGAVDEPQPLFRRARRGASL